MSGSCRAGSQSWPNLKGKSKHLSPEDSNGDGLEAQATIQGKQCPLQGIHQEASKREGVDPQHNWQSLQARAMP